MSTFNDIQNALNTKLAATSGLPVIYYPNMDKEPVQGTSYIRPTLLPANTTLLTLNNEDMHQGIYQIDIYTELKKGTAPTLLIADAICTAFRRTKLTANSTIVHAQQISMSQAQRVESWWHMYISINYICIA